MNLDISRYSKTVVTLLILAAIAKALSLGTIYFLNKKGVSQVIDNSYTMPYKSYRFSKSFGVVDVVVKSEDVAKVNQPIYNLSSLELKAIYKTHNGGFIVALDNTKGKRSVFIKMLSEYNGYTLKELTNEKATFERNGQKYKLEFKKKKSSALMSEPIARPKSPKYSDDVIRAVSKSEVHKYTKDFKSIWKSISIKEVKQNGKIDGFKVTSIKQGTIFDKLGLKKDDIIMSVNNKPMKSYASAFKIYKDVKTMTSLKITVKRNNQIKDLEYEIY